MDVFTWAASCPDRGAVPTLVRAFLLRTLMPQVAERAAVIGRLHAQSHMRELTELLIDLEERRDLALEVAD